MDMKTLSRVALGLGISLLVSAGATLIVISAGTAIAAIQGGIGLAAIAFYFATNKDAIGRTFAGKATLFYGVSLVAGALIIGALVAANYVATKKQVSWDLTKAGIFTLADDTVKTLTTLPGEVKVAAFYGESEPAAAELKDLLGRYKQHAGDKLAIEWVDPYVSPERVKEKGIKEGGPRVIFSYGNTEQRAAELSEESLTNAIVKVLRTSEKKIYFTSGHGEADTNDASSEYGYGAVAKKMGDEGLKIETIQLTTTQEIPADAAAVAIIGPQKPFFEPEIESLRKYLQKSGRLLVALEPGYDDPAFEKLLNEWGFEFDNSLIVDPMSRLMGGGTAIPVVQQYAEHDVTKDFGLVTLFPTARPITSLGEADSKPTILALSNPTAWGETNVEGGQAQYDDGEKRGALGLAAAVSKKNGDNETRIIAFGDAEFGNNKYSRAGGNADFFLNSVNWLASQESRITIRPKQREASRLLLTEENARFINLFSMNGLPILVLAMGLSVWLVRKAK